MNLRQKRHDFRKNERRSFVAGYIECAIWADLIDRDGEPLDHAYDTSDIARSSRHTIIRECLDFLNQAENLIDDDTPSTRGNAETYENAGHDFWLTRNGHGAGFWDGDWPHHGRELTELCRPYGAVYLYVDDDEQIYFS